MTLRTASSFSSRLRPVLEGRRGAVAAAHPLAVAAGQQVLVAGGSAVDAVIAAQAVRNSNPRIHSCLLRRASATNACKCLTSKDITSAKRGSSLWAKLAIASCVTEANARGD